jgi:GNAT superfamily N-acetyltransferase
MTIKKATSSDVTNLLSLIESLAHYERLPPPDAAARKRLEADMLQDPPKFNAFFAIHDERPVAYAIVLEAYSSFLALPTLYLEDIFVLPDFRGKGIGFELFKAMVAEARRRGCGRMEWAVLEWNKPAIDFYERLGAARLNDWHYYRLTSEEFERVLAL